MAFCERKVSANWWFRANSKKYFSLLRVYRDWAFPSFKNSVKREVIKQTTTFAGASRSSKLRFAVWQHYTHQLSNGRSSSKSFIFSEFCKILARNIAQKIKQQHKNIFQSVSIKLSTTSRRNHELRRGLFSFNYCFCLFVCFLCYHHSITINHTDPTSLALSRSERGPEFKTSSF